MIEWNEPSGAATRTRSPPAMPCGTVTVSRVVTAPMVGAFGPAGAGCAGCMAAGFIAGAIMASRAAEPAARGECELATRTRTHSALLPFPTSS